MSEFLFGYYERWVSREELTEKWAEYAYKDQFPELWGDAEVYFEDEISVPLNRGSNMMISSRNRSGNSTLIVVLSMTLKGAAEKEKASGGRNWQKSVGRTIKNT